MKVIINFRYLLLKV